MYRAMYRHLLWNVLRIYNSEGHPGPGKHKTSVILSNQRQNTISAKAMSQWYLPCQTLIKEKGIIKYFDYQALEVTWIRLKKLFKPPIDQFF